MNSVAKELGRVDRGIIDDKVAREARGGGGGGWAGPIPSFG
jgi:hypothetical protein